MCVCNRPVSMPQAFRRLLEGVARRDLDRQTYTHISHLRPTLQAFKVVPACTHRLFAFAYAAVPLACHKFFGSRHFSLPSHISHMPHMPLTTGDKRVPNRCRLQLLGHEHHRLQPRKRPHYAWPGPIDA